MAKRLVGGVVRAGRVAVSVVGLAVVLALVFGAAMGATGGSFILGKANAATTVSMLTASVAGPALTLINNSSGAAATALDITVASGKAPLRVNAAAGTATNLSADKIDGKDSSQFATTTSEGWRQISVSGTTPFDRFYDGWSNFDSQHSTAAYYKGPQGIVHLKGVVRGGFYDCCYNTERGMIFLLPQGYWPSEHRVFTAVSGSNTAVGRVDIGRGVLGNGEDTFRDLRGSGAGGGRKLGVDHAGRHLLQGGGLKPQGLTEGPGCNALAPHPCTCSRR